jgi:kumamolisin
MTTRSKATAPFQFAPVPGSQKLAPLGCEVVKDELHGRKIVSFSVQAPTAADPAAIERMLKWVSTGHRPPLSVAELEALTGADPAHIEQITQAVKAAGLTALPRSDADVSHGIVRVTGTYAAARRFLPGLKLSHSKDEDGRMFFARSGEINARSDLPIVGVFGLDTRKVARTHHRFHDEAIHPHAGGRDHGTSRDISEAQGVPVKELDKTRIATGYISLGGDNGSKMQEGLKIAADKAGIPTCKVVGVSVNGAAVEGDPDDDATIENALDMQAHALHNPNGYCVVFVAPNDDDSFALAMETAVAYGGVQDGTATLPLLGVSISWGMAESSNTKQSLRRWERALTAARLRGLIVTAATGDDGSRDKTRAATPDAPSCVPGMIGAAGVKLIFDGTGKVSGQTVWNDMRSFGGATGGGVSAVFPVTQEELSLGLDPALFVSASTNRPGHLSATIADDAAPSSGPLVYLRDGSARQTGGTSNSSPVINIKLAKIQGALTTRIPDMIGFIYRNAKRGIFAQVTEPGNNGDYSVSPGDLLAVPTGFGVIVWDAFLAAARQEMGGAARKAKR